MRTASVIGDDHRDVGLGGEPLEGFLAVAGAQHPELGGENRLQRVEHARLVVHDQDRRLVHRASRAGGHDAGAAGAIAGSRRR